VAPLKHQIPTDKQAHIIHVSTLTKAWPH